MKNKGFTLIELIAVIVILAILALIVLPSVGDNLRTSRETLYKSQIENIKEVTKEWAAVHRNLLPNLENQSIDVTLRQLKDEGLIDEDLKNPLTDEKFPDSMTVTITRISSNYNFVVNEP